MKKRILIADDEENIRTLVAATLEGDGIEIIQAENGGAALAHALHEPFDLAVLDWNMPELSGVQVLQCLRQHPATAALPVIMLTAMAQQKDRHYAVGLGVSEYLVKPFSPLQLMKAVQRATAAQGDKETGDEAIDRVRAG